MDGWTNDELIDAIDDVLRTTVSIARDIPEADADLPTGCPGWTVRDQLAHMAGLEQVLAGAPQPTIELPPLDHVESEFDVYMERQIHVRRQLPLAAIADELDGLRPRRIAQLRTLAEQGDPEVPGPLGTRPLSATLPIRAFDLWAHEQDIRRAVGLPVRQQCDAATVALERALAAWTAVLPKQLDGRPGRIIVEVTDPTPAEHVIELAGDGPTVTVTGDLGQLTAAFCGRSTADHGVAGDPDLAAALTDRLGLTP